MPVQRSKKHAIGSHHESSVPLVKQEQKPAAFAFAPNVTPGTYTDPPSPSVEESGAPPQSILFPDVPPIQFDNLDSSSFATPPDAAAAASKKKKAGARKKAGEDPSRPPNAFILFRASFIKSQHVPASVESNHSTLSKIIGMTWQNLPPEERSVWQVRAALALEDHKRRFPDLAIRSATHAGAGKAKAGAKKPPKRKLKEVEPKDIVRCAKIAELLCEGMKGAELDAAIEEFDKTHVKPEPQTRFEAPLTVRAYRRRSSSAPIPDGVPGAGAFKLEQPESSSMAQYRASSVSPDAHAIKPIELEFNLDMFAPGAPQAHAQPVFSFEAPADAPVFDPGFSFHPAGLARPPSRIDPLDVNPLSYQGVSSPSADSYVDPAMPPLVDRPFDPATDLHFPRLSIGTLNLLTQLDSYPVQPVTPTSPNAPSPYPLYDAPTPPPLSACTSFSQEDRSAPGTPVHAAPWGWPTSAQAHSPGEYVLPSPQEAAASGYAPEPCAPAPLEYQMEAFAKQAEYAGFDTCAGHTPAPTMVTFRVNYAGQPKTPSTDAPVGDTIAPWAVHANVPAFAF